MNTVLVICAHADDEAFGIAGTLAKHVMRGDPVHELFVADGVTARGDHYDLAAYTEELAARKKMALNASAIIGAEEPCFLDLPDNRLDRLDLLDIVKFIEQHLRLVAPSIVYTNSGADLNVDHQLTHQAVLTACRPLPDEHVRSIYAFETLSSTEWSPPSTGKLFHPTRFVDISDVTSIKRQVIEAYGEETRPFPHPRSMQVVEAKWTVRGAEVGLPAAEALEVIREIA